MGSAIKFKHTDVSRQQGEQARLKVVKGPDYGAIYVITGQRASVGRGEENDIVILDLKASRRHAEVAIGKSGGWIVSDAGSANGILHNGNAVKTAKLNPGDTITLGETTLEFVTSEAATMILMAPPKSLAQIEAEQAAFEAQKQKVRSLGFLSFASGKSGAPSNGLLKNPKVLLIGVALLAVLLFFDEDPKPKNDGKKADNKEARDLASYLPETEDIGGTAKTAEMFFKIGFREYREHNYLRAKTQFETVLQMSPNHRMATLYLENCTKAIEDEVKFHLDRGKKSLDSGKLKDSRGHYEAILRLLFRDQANPAFAEAKDQLEKVEKKMRKEGDSS